MKRFYSKETWYAILLLSIILVGSILRIRIFLSPAFLWSDEASLALNIVERDYSQLFLRLDYDQHAPIGFLFLTKFACETFGYNEQTFRIVSAVCGIISPILMLLILNRTTSRVGVIFGVALTSLSPFLIRYSNEFKPYVLDAIVTGILLFSYKLLLPKLAELNWGGKPPSVLLAIATVSPACILFSFSSVFVITGLTAHMIFNRTKAKDWISLFHLTVCSIPWCCTFLAYYALLLSNTSGDSYLQNFWSNKFWELPSSLYAVKNNFQLLLVPFSGSLGMSKELSFLLVLLGLLTPKNRENALIQQSFLFVILATVAASLMGKWPFASRLMIFMAPLAIIILSWGISHICEGKNFIVKTAVFISIIIPLSIDVNELVDNYSETASYYNLASIVEDHYQADDVFLVYYLADRELQLYQNLDVFPNIRSEMTVNLINQHWIEFERQFDAIPPEKRVWILFGNGRKLPFDEIKAIKFHCSKKRELVKDVSGKLILLGPRSK